MNDVICAILNRASEPRLTAPAPDQATLDAAFQCAFTAPDHALLRPWRYLVIEGEGLHALGELFADSLDANDPNHAERCARVRQSPLRAPMIIVGITSYREHPKVPPVEQAMSAAVGMGYLALALDAAGYGAMWRTGSPAHSDVVEQGLGLADHEKISGFLYVGTVERAKPRVPRPEVADKVSRWPHTDQ
ncbi:nitroreductase family protein [Marinobacter sp. X15-166B]|uniref:nitroreductase family protein n=1 Tax=Marinobacter sp. X15-166B TaxID=1897620 RepID=UPI00085C4BF0|nr:nitroreductase family protein [Marinobacter sp. X15-166B]OEY67347.1 nitroreductase [Marinobacter sp. X15-166B]